MQFKPADSIDAANDRAEAERQAIIQAHQSQAKRVLAYKATCHYCNTFIAPPKRFCDDECRDEYDYEQNRRKVNTKV